MRRPTDTSTTEKRLIAIAQILARGFLRLQVSRELPHLPLDESGPPEAPCGAKVLNPKSDENAA